MAYNFNLDLSFGEQFEIVIRDYLNKISCHNYISTEGYYPDYDLYCTHCDRTVECKFDRRISETNNFCFEIPTLQHTKAMYLFYGSADNNFVNVFRIDDLKRWLRRKVSNGRYKQRVVGENNTKGYLVSKFDIKDEAFCDWLNIEYKQDIFKLL